VSYADDGLHPGASNEADEDVYGISQRTAARIADAILAEDVAPSSDGSPTSGSSRRNRHLDGYGDPRIV
jgi:hypothetical protein